MAHTADCVAGEADGFPCDRVDLREEVALNFIGGGRGSDIWGWTDPMTGKEYALMGRSNGTAFLDISDPTSPIFLGNLPTHSTSSSWRDIKTYQNYAFIVADLTGSHGMQIFDLTQLRNVANPPVTFTNTAHYDDFGDAHNIVINEDSGFAYAVGGDTCSGGPHIVNIQDPLNPSFVGCFTGDGYTHDGQCVNYIGPDPDYTGSELCFGSNTDTLTIIDMTVKTSPTQISRTGYTGVGYTHQGWLTEDHRYFLMNDEFDESTNGHNTRTYIWDVSDLDNPFVIDTFDGPTAATDHNLYVKGNYVYEANYQAGLRIMDISDIANGNLTEVAHFDIHPDSNNAGTGGGGAWSVYPYFESGNVIVSGIQEGLFILRPNLCSTPVTPTALSAIANGDNQIDLSWTGTGNPEDTYSVYRSFGSCPGSSFELMASGLTGTTYSDTVSGQVEYAYHVTTRDVTGLCESAVSLCDSATTTGVCNAPPIFDGIEDVSNPGSASCALDLSWSAGAPNCGAGLSYSVHRATTSGFTPSVANRVASGISGTSYTDGAVDGGETYFYVVRATDVDNSSEESNLEEASGKPSGPIANGSLETGAEVGDPPLDLSSTVNLSGGDLGVVPREPDHVGWEFSSARSNTGDRSFFSTYSNNQCVTVVTPPLMLTAGQSSSLSFWTAYEIESRWDGGVLELSDDGGSNWTQLTPTPGYPNTFRSSGDACGYATGTPSFTGTNLTWTEHTVDLSSYNGTEVLIRWVFSTDSASTREGWYVDDIEITEVQVPGPCTNANALYDDGFESGDTSEWTVTFIEGQ